MIGPLYVAILGAVDSGKTTFYKYYTGLNLKEPQNRTQTVRFLETRVGSTRLNLVDCPGHQAFTYHKSIALDLCDLVLYFVDANSPDLELLKELKKYDKPLLIIINKMDLYLGSRSLRDLLTPQSQAEIYEAIEKIGIIDMSYVDLNLFIELRNLQDLSSKDQAYYFPLSVKTAWGMQEFETFLAKIQPLLRRNQHSYLYSCFQNSNRFYCKFIDRTDEVSQYYVNNYPQFSLRQLNYDPVLKLHFTELPVLKEILRSNSVLRVLKKGQILSTKEPTLEESKALVDTLRQQLSKGVFKNYEFLLYGDSDLRSKTLLNLLGDLNLSTKVLKKPDFDQSSSKHIVHFFWLDRSLRSTTNSLIENSLYRLIDKFQQWIKEEVKKQKAQVLDLLKSKLLCGKIYPQHIFSNENKKIVIGGQLYAGHLSLRDQLCLINNNGIVGNEATVIDIQQEKKKLSQLKTPQSLCGFKLALEKPYDSAETYFIGKKTLKNLNSLRSLMNTPYFKEKELSEWKSKLEESFRPMRALFNSL